ncbi:hypothetical protein HB815_01595 [Listeria booriae]|uniref:hypothetical protein n=1 Tax=Listeria booriae TaxID=1552123 RepID=UPI00162666C2|nr:hypothetical protein [Listeria booriae]MBC1209609.1 hypothetical protein [Listeria booriae]
MYEYEMEELDITSVDYSKEYFVERATQYKEMCKQGITLVDSRDFSAARRLLTKLRGMLRLDAKGSMSSLVPKKAPNYYRAYYSRIHSASVEVTGSVRNERLGTSFAGISSELGSVIIALKQTE